MKRSMVIAAIGAATGLAGIAGWFRPLPADAGQAGARQASWHLPAQADLERSTAAQFAATSGVAWLGEGNGAGDTGPGATWTLLGVVGPPGNRAVLVKAGSDPVIKRLSSGDNLPDGSKLVAVGSSGIIIDREGCRIERPLYPGAEATDAATSGPGCPTPGTN